MPAEVIKGKVGRLTPREREVLDLQVEDQSRKQIASELQISTLTCSKHRTQVLEKLDVDNDVQLVRCVHAWKTSPS